MAEANPFGDIDRAFDETLKQQLELLKELDEMENDVTEWESSFLDSVLKQLEKKIPLSQKQIEIVRRMSEQYDVECDL
jgi:hypothetical protein